ncbi:MAG: undecaprenyl-phosphate alpha-N-acetylglucosaminyltransferase, partial [uncultured bacterium]
PISIGIGIGFINNPFGTGIIDLAKYPILSDLIALFWIVFLMNILNMGAKGVDGQLSGTVAVAAIVIGILSLKFSADIAQWPVIILASITAGSFLGFLPWHIYPQKIMPSFSGSNLAGFMLAILSILSTTKVGTLAVVLGVPIIDTGYTIIRRIASGKSPVWGDRGHLHHKLLDNGWSKRQVAIFYWVVTAVLGVFSLSLNASLKLYTIIGVAFLVGGLLLWLTYRSK